MNPTAVGPIPAVPMFITSSHVAETWARTSFGATICSVAGAAAIDMLAANTNGPNSNNAVCGSSVVVEKNAGAEASFTDDAFREAGCTIADSAADIWSGSDIILQVRPPEGDRASGLKDSQTLISFLYPGQNPELLEQLTKSGGRTS